MIINIKDKLRIIGGWGWLTPTNILFVADIFAILLILFMFLSAPLFAIACSVISLMCVVVIAVILIRAFFE